MKEKDEFKHDGREGSKPFVTIRVVKMPFNLFQPFWQIYIQFVCDTFVCIQIQINLHFKFKHPRMRSMDADQQHTNT